MKNEICEIITKRMDYLDDIISPYASKNSDSIRIKKEKSDIRSTYFRDIDRIIHSLSYTRYIDKTQVFSNSIDDNISKRIIHVQLVSKIARTIGRALNLNEDLIEAISLGHDIGHVPYGHVGERILNEISLKYNEGMFNHNIQSVRTFLDIENNGNGINLSIQVLDGIMCHNGEFVKDKYYCKKKTKEEFFLEYEKSYSDKRILKHLIPMTLEGCVVRISDIIAYLGRDIEDAIELGVINKNDLPLPVTKILGSTNKEIVNNIILNIIENSFDKDYIKLSDDMYNAIKELKEFNYQNIYDKANTKEETNKYIKMFNDVFNFNLKEIKNKNSKINQVFLNKMSDEYLNKYSDARKVIDYISGMTDTYFNYEYESLK